MNRDPLLVSLGLLTLALFAPHVSAQSPGTKGSSQEPYVVYAKPEQTAKDFSAHLPAEIRGERIFKGKDVDKKVVIDSKPEPKYTDEARKRGQQGVVTLYCVLGSTGRITDIYVVYGLPYGLTEAALAAAKEIKFEPAMKDGKPVSMWVLLLYNFEL
jgi:TonB family protein